MTTTFLNLPPSARPSASSGGPSSPPTTDASSSGPGTPASGISSLSTTAIKDGHEGHHPIINFDVAAERVARLGGIGTPPNIGYFDRERSLLPPVTPSASSAISGMSDGRTTPEGDTYGSNSTQAKRETMAAVLARRQIATNQQQQQSQQNQIPQQTQQASDSITTRMGEDSPASIATTQTTPSVAEARSTARLIDGMTYDVNVVDTTVEGMLPRYTKMNDDAEMKDN